MEQRCCWNRETTYLVEINEQMMWKEEVEERITICNTRRFGHVQWNFLHIGNSTHFCVNVCAGVKSQGGGGVFMEMNTQQDQLAAPIPLWHGINGCAAFLGLTTHTWPSPNCSPVWTLAHSPASAGVIREQCCGRGRFCSRLQRGETVVAREVIYLVRSGRERAMCGV